MGATNVLASGAPCFIIRQIRAPVAQILDQCLQAIGIFHLWTIGLEQRQGFIELAPPEMVEELAQQCLLRHPPTRNQAGQFVAFLTEVIPQSIINSLPGQQAIWVLKNVAIQRAPSPSSVSLEYNPPHNSNNRYNCCKTAWAPPLK